MEKNEWEEVPSLCSTEGVGKLMDFMVTLYFLPEEAEKTLGSAEKLLYVCNRSQCLSREEQCESPLVTHRDLPSTCSLA